MKLNNAERKIPVFKEHICPVCGYDLLVYDHFHYSKDEGGVYTWECASCGATGREHYELTFNASRYDVTLADGTKFEEIPTEHIAELFIDPETFDSLIPESVNYCVNSSRKNEQILSRTVDFGNGYSAELRVIADSEGESHFINVRLLHDGKIVYNHDKDDDSILNAWPLQDGNGNKFLLVVKEGE